MFKNFCANGQCTNFPLDITHGIQGTTGPHTSKDHEAEAPKSSMELTVFVATVRTREDGRQLLAKSWRVRENPAMLNHYALTTDPTDLLQMQKV